MKLSRQSIRAAVLVMMLALAACEGDRPQLEIKLESDYSQIISEIRGVNATLTEKLAAIETAVKAQTTSLETKLALVEAAVEAGFADNAAAQGLIQDAIAALEGSATEKLAAIDAAVKAQTASLESKLALIEKAVETGFADSAQAQGLIKDAIAALEGTTAAKLAAIEAAVKSQASGLDTKLAAIETAVKAGFADSAKAQGLIKEAVESLAGTTQEKLAAIESAVKAQSTSLEAKLDLIEAAINKGFADSAKAQGLIEQAIKTLDSNTAGKLAEILQKITGLPNYSGDLNDIKKAIDTLRKMFVLSVSLDKASLTLYVGARSALTATVFPDDATDKSVTWKSSDPAVAEVSQDGTVAARKPGTATITVTTVVGGNTATCEVTVDYESVDLGLPSGLKWATMNVGATEPEEYGDYFAWGEVSSTKSDYSWSTYQYANGAYDKLTKYCGDASYGNNGYTDALTTLEKTDDAARANWGGSWRMPTKAEFEELLNNCDGVWTTQNGVSGYKFTAKNGSGNSIFLPAAGYRYGASIEATGSYSSDYWSSSLNTGTPVSAWCLRFPSGNAATGYDGRYYGQSVRPVTD